MRARSLHTAFLGVTIAIIAIVAPATRAGAASAGTCTTTSGVTVIVDLTYFHRAIERGCAPGRPATALAAMQTAGFSTAGTTRYGDAFVCRIDNLPSPQAEACTDTPPAKSSWSFYSALPTDAGWTYATVGVLSFRPAPGTIIAFAFGNMARPGIAPSAAIRVTQAAAPTTTARPPSTATPSTVAPITVAPAAITATTISVATTTVTTPAPTSTTLRAAPSSTTSTTKKAGSSQSAAARIVDRPPITHVTVHNDSGSPTGAVLALVIVVAIAGATALTIRARRRRTA